MGELEERFAFFELTEGQPVTLSVSEGSDPSSSMVVAEERDASLRACLVSLGVTG